MVRLKVAEIIRALLCALFQFLMVRLKVNVILRFVWFNVFQFLMVRLKAFADVDRGANNFVSIPYGTIKRTNMYN